MNHSHLSMWWYPDSKIKVQPLANAFSSLSTKYCHSISQFCEMLSCVELTFKGGFWVFFAKYVAHFISAPVTDVYQLHNWMMTTTFWATGAFEKTHCRAQHRYTFVFTIQNPWPLNQSRICSQTSFCSAFSITVNLTRKWSNVFCFFLQQKPSVITKDASKG